MIKFDKVKNELLKRTNNCSSECTITMKVDGTEVRIVPMQNYGYGEYWFAHGFSRDGFETIDELANYILNYEDEKKISDYPFPVGVAEPEHDYKRK